MAKKKSWFNLVKRLFISDSPSSPEKDKRRRWVFGKLKRRKLASLAAPPPPTYSQHQKDFDKATISTAVPDVVPPVTETVCCFSNSESANQVEEATENILADSGDSHILQSDIHEIQIVAAIKIQTAFRGFLARKALRALKGLVRLQAIIRGRAVRRQALTTLKCLQTIVNIQSEVCSKRCVVVKSTTNSQENKLEDFREKDIKIDLNSQRRWDDSLLSKEEETAHFMSKREAEIKRERIKEYWLTHRRSAESEHNRVYARRRYWLEQWVDAQLAKQNSGAANSEKVRARDQLKVRKFQKEYHAEELDSPAYVPRRSFHKRQLSTGDDSALAISPAVPTYMAATESAKAKTRSMSSPRLRPISTDTYSEINSPYKHKHSPISSINSDATSISRLINPKGLSQRSPCLKSIPGPIKSYRSLKEDLSLNSNVSMPSFVRHGAC